MPFDGLVKPDVANLDHCSINALLASHGIVPVSNELLERHKTEQLRKYPASLFHRRPGLHRALLLLACAATLASIEVFMSYNFVPSAASIAALGVMLTSLMAAAELGLFTRVKRPATWQESRFPVDAPQARASLPRPILDLVDQIDDGSRTVTFTVGTLYQEHVTLDPYILAETFDFETMKTTTACLGIWDGDEIIAIAKPA